MEDLKENRYLVKQTSYIVDLKDVDFITWSANERDLGKFLAKLHIGTKETRYMCQSAEELKGLLQGWADAKGKEIEIELKEIEGLIWD